MIAALIGLPLLGATVLLLGGRRTNAWGHFLAVAMSAASFLLGAFLFIQMVGKSEEEREIGQHLFDWISVGAFQIPFDLHLLDWVRGARP